MPFKFNPFTRKLDLTETGGGGTGILTITGDTGGAVGADGSNNINIVGSAPITVGGNAGTNTITIGSSNPFFTWSVITANQMAISQEGYMVDGVGVIEISLPLSSSVGDIFSVIDIGGNGWKITQSAGQQINFGTSASTVGVTGYVQSIFRGDCATFICSEASLTWEVFPGIGNLTIA